MLDFVPLAGARRKVTDRQRTPGLVGQPLQFQLPEAQTLSVTAAAIGRDQYGRGVAYSWRPSARHHPRIEATANAAVSWSVPDVHEALVAPDIVDAVGIGARDLRLGKSCPCTRRACFTGRHWRPALA